MDSSKLNNYLQILANFGIVAGLILVGVQINQNTRIAAADMTNRAYEVAAQYHLTMMGENPMKAVAKAATKPEELTDEELLVLERITAFWIDFDSRGEINVANNLSHRNLADKYLKIHARTLYGPNPISAAIWQEQKVELGPETHWINVVDNELLNFEHDRDSEFLRKLHSVIQQQSLAK